MDGKVVTFRARIHTLRRLSAKLVFIVFRQQTITVQGVLQTSSREGHEAAGQSRYLGIRRKRTL
jgi:aspartyl/asparaginyl-tRNA synthetase